MEHILVVLTKWMTDVFGSMGYLGIILFMGIESACIPLPSEVIMPVSGYLVSTGKFNIWWTGVSGALGCVWGSVAAYYAGLYGGRPFIEKYGKYVLIRKRDIDRADRWYSKYGVAVIFFSRLLPVVRTFISFPAGMHKVNMFKFVIYTFLGSFPWCLALAYAGKVMGDNGKEIGQIRKAVSGYFHGADVVIGVVLVVMFALWLRHHLRPDEEDTKIAAGEVEEPQKV
ncbi:MAG: DedA family protein [Armatimonadota bacterium]|nr:DedA family protein [Armatimonadota bacterium]